MSDDPEELSATFRRWLEAYPFAVQEIPGGDAYRWLLRATGDAGEYAIGLRIDTPNRVLISAFLDCPQGVSTQVKEATIVDVQIGLLAFDVSVAGLIRPLSRLHFLTDLYLEGATQETFFRALQRVRNALLFVNQNIDRAVGGGGARDEGIAN